MDVPEGDIVESGSGEGSLGQHRIIADQGGALGARVARFGQSDVRREHRGQGGIELGSERRNLGGADLRDLSVHARRGEALETVVSAQVMPRRPRQASELERAAFGREAQQLGAAHHVHAVEADRFEDIDGSGPAVGGRGIVVADDHRDRYAGVVQSSQVRCQFALPGRVRIAVPVGVAGEQDQIDLLADGGIDDEFQAAREVGQARVQPGRWIHAAVVLHTEVEVGKMEQTHGDLVEGSCREKTVLAGLPLSAGRGSGRGELAS